MQIGVKALNAISNSLHSILISFSHFPLRFLEIHSRLNR